MPTNSSAFLSPPTGSRIKKKPPVSDMTLADIEHNIAKNELEARQEREAIAADRRNVDEARRDLDGRVNDARRELALDLGCSPAGLSSAIALRATTTGTKAPVWAAIAQIANGTAEEVDLPLAREARHVLATIGELPEVRRNDAAFGSAKPLRSLPRVTLIAPSEPDPWWDSFVQLTGLPRIRFAGPEGETYEQAKRRIDERQRRYLYDRNSDRNNDALAARERELVYARIQKETASARAAHKLARLEQRTMIAASIEVALGSLELDIAWWWTRDLRRHITGERRYASSIEQVAHVWHATQMLGVRFTFTGQA